MCIKLTVIIYLTCNQIEQDAYQDDLGFSTGWIGKSSSGKVRGPAASDKTQVSISKRLQVMFTTIKYRHVIATNFTATITTTASIRW